MAHGRVADQPTWLMPKWSAMVMAGVVTVLNAWSLAFGGSWIDLITFPLIVLAVICSARWPRYALLLALPVLASPLWGDTSGNNYVAAVLVLPVVLATGRRTLMIVTIVALFVWTAARGVVTSLQHGVSAASTTYMAAAALVVGLLARPLAQTWRESEVEVVDLAARTVRVRNQQRSTLAREMNDGVAHQIKMIAHIAQQGGPRTDDDLPDALAQVEERARFALNDLRLMLGVLRDGDRQGGAVLSQAVAERHLPSAVIGSVVSQLRRSGHDLEVDVDAAVDDLPPTLRQAVARLLQEATSNVLIHAPGSPCEIVVQVNALRVQVEVTNGLGRGVDSPPEYDADAQWGLVGLRERVEELGGSFVAGQVEERWVVKAVLPRHHPRRG